MSTSPVHPWHWAVLRAKPALVCWGSARMSLRVKRSVKGEKGLSLIVRRRDWRRTEKKRLFRRLMRDLKEVRFAKIFS